jgi:hypothetical protein
VTRESTDGGVDTEMGRLRLLRQMTPDMFPVRPPPPPRRDDEEPRNEGSEVNDVVDLVVDAADLTLDIAGSSCEIAGWFDALPDCSVVDCDPGCL